MGDIINFKPYPKLWEAFADEPELLKNRTFEALTGASRALAMHGKEAAIAVLRPRKAVVNEFRSSADLKTPDRPASAELKRILADFARDHSIEGWGK